MNLRFVGHILRKDVRRLWWMIALTLALLWRLTHFDSWRAYAAPGEEEAWLNILLPLAWSLLIALAAMEDPVLGEAPFWVTVPAGWQSVLTAKAAFIVIVIQVPYFIACAVVLQARGFAPFEYLPDLCFRQFALLAVTLPMLALTTLVRNVTQFMMIAIALVTAIAAPSMDSDGAVTHHIREILAYSTVTAAGLWIAISQYVLRRTFAARAIGVAALLVAGVIWWSPRERFYGLQTAVSPAPATAGQLSVHLSDPSGKPGQIPFRFGSGMVGIPISVSGSNNNQVRVAQAALTLHDGGGQSYRVHPHINPGETNSLFGSLYSENGFPTWQMLSVDADLLAHIGNVPVDLKGRMLVDYYRRPDPARLSVGSNAPAPGLGRCSSDIRLADNPNDEMLHVDCESPRGLPLVDVKLTDPATGREWDRYLGSSYTFTAQPRGDWLSPVDRADTFFQSTDEEHYNAFGGQWLVPREAMQSVQVGITPEFPEGSSLVNYEIPNIRLRQFLVKP